MSKQEVEQSLLVVVGEQMTLHRPRQSLLACHRRIHLPYQAFLRPSADLGIDHLVLHHLRQSLKTCRRLPCHLRRRYCMSARPKHGTGDRLLENVIWVCCVESVEASSTSAREASTESTSPASSSSALETLLSDLVIQVSFLLDRQLHSKRCFASTYWI